MLLSKLLTPFSTSFLFIISLFYQKNIFLFLLLSIVTITSLSFWYNPIKNSIIHKIDGLFAKITIIIFILYKLFIKTNDQIIFFFNALLMLYFLYLSDIYSNIKWCCKKHLYFHLLAHLFAFICLIIF